MQKEDEGPLRSQASGEVGGELDTLRERVAEHFRVAWHYEEMNKSCWNAADRAIEALRPELDRLTFERDAADATANLLVQQLEDLRDDVLGDESLLVPEVATAAGRTVERLADELALAQERIAKTRQALRLDEKWSVQHGALAVRSERDRAVAERDVLRARLEATLRTSDYQIGDIVCWRGDRWFEGRIVGETAPEHKYLDSEVWDLEVTDPGTRYADFDMTGRPVHVSEDALVLVRRDKPDPLPEASSEASPLNHLVTLSSDTGVMGEWQAFCHGCEERAKGDMPRVAFWKDQHEADTLQVQAPVFFEEDEPIEDVKAAFDNGTKFTTAPSTSGAPVRIVSEGRPAASTPPAAGEADTTPREFHVGDEVLWRWHRLPGTAPWFKARLTEKNPANFPAGWAGEVTDPGTNYTADHDGEVPPGFLVYMDVPSMTLVSPSPSQGGGTDG